MTEEEKEEMITGAEEFQVETLMVAGGSGGDPEDPSSEKNSAQSAADEKKSQNSVLSSVRSSQSRAFHCLHHSTYCSY